MPAIRKLVRIATVLALASVPVLASRAAYADLDDKGNNVLASALLIQIQGDAYVAVWPKENATAELKLPYKGW